MSETNIKIYRNDELIHDCTLCKNPEGRVGWYDTVGGTFHDRADEPASREPLFVQYIDTGFYPLNKQGATHIDAGNKWISVEEAMPDQFVSVLGYMTDAGEFPPVRECYLVGGAFFFPALRDVHPVSHWMPMPPKEVT